MLSRRFVGFLFVLSGAAGLIYQVVWTRSLTLLFGSTTLAVSTVLTAFMAGLALGSFLLGRVADTRPKALPLYALLEVGIAVTALLFPIFIDVLTPAYLWMHGKLQGSYLLFPVSRFLLCFVSLLLPTALMGGTLPVMTRFFVKEKRAFRGNVGILYGLNTFGAMLGCFAAGFFLIPELGISKVVWLAAGLNVLVALGAMVIARYESEGAPSEPDGSASAIDQSAPADASPAPAVAVTALVRNPKIILWLFGLAGFASLAYEVLWVRALQFFLGRFAVYAFVIMLTTFLFGIAAGSAAYPLILRRTRHLVFSFGVIETAIGLFGAGSVLIFAGLFELIDSLESMQLFGNTWWNFILARAGGCFAVMLLPTFLMGLAFPVASNIYMRAGRGFGETVGNVYAANTVGAILGSLLAGFLLLPLIGVARSIATVSFINLLIGGVALFLRFGRGVLRTPAIVVLLLIVVGGGGNIFLSSGRPMILYSRHFKDPARDMRLVYSSEGATASLAVLNDRTAGYYGLNINGETTAATTYTDMQVHLMLSHTPLLLIDEPEQVLVVGFGMGSTSHGAVLHPTVKEVDCVELVPKEVETARHFEDVNFGVLDHPKFNLIIDDGRNYIVATKKKYDLISFNAIHPIYSPALYTVDFYEECRKKLTPKGAVCAWVPTNRFTERHFQILLKTFISVFPHSSLWYVNPNHLVLISTPKPLHLDFARFRERLSNEAIQRDLARYTMENPYQLLAYHLMDAPALERYTRTVPVNSDNNPYLEYSRELYTRAEIVSAMLLHRASILPYLDIQEDRQTVIDTLRRHEKAAFHLLASQAIDWLGALDPDVAGRNWDSDAELKQALQYLPNDKNILAIAGLPEHLRAQLRAAVNDDPLNGQAWDRLIRFHTIRDEWDQIARLQPELASVQTAQATLANGLLQLREGNWDEAERQFRLLSGRGSPRLRALAQPFVQITRIERKSDSGELNLEDLLQLASLYWSNGERRRGEELFRTAMARFPNDPRVYYSFGLALEEPSRFREAERLFSRALSLPIQRAELRAALREALVRSRVLVAIEENPNRITRVETADGRLFEVDPGSSALRVQIGRLLLNRGMLDHAAVHLRIAATLDPDNADAREGLGNALARMGLFDEAEEEFKLALRLDPARQSVKDELRQIKVRRSR